MLRHLAVQLQVRRPFSVATRTKPFQVAIDGPAASGKSTTAKMVAQQLGFDYIDTGAFYRCITLASLSKGIDPSDPANATQISDIAEQSRIALQTIFSPPSTSIPGGAPEKQVLPLPTTRVFLDFKDVSSDIRTTTVSQHVSAVAAIGKVREAVLQKVRSIGAGDNEQDLDMDASLLLPIKEGLVMDGRDIGTVILPHADLKVFLVADSRVRAERRLRELVRNELDPTPKNLDIDAVQRDLERRDELDRTRKVSPLRKADDAMELDTSGLTIEEQVNVIVQEVERRRRGVSAPKLETRRASHGV
ncbi:MAG: cytidylate kinase [Benniella sp.]|nr:MAG: cytidylate kinase [Benniella sp.]